MPPLTCSVSALCGGCPLLTCTPDEAKAEKLGVLRQELVHCLGERAYTVPIRWVGASSDLGYRHRIRLKVEVLGHLRFFNPEKTPDCAVLLPALSDALKFLFDFNRQNPLAFESVDYLELRAPDLDGRVGLYLTIRPTIAATPSQQLRTRLEQLPPHWLWGISGSALAAARQRHALADLYHYVPLTSFLQVDRTMNDTLLADFVARAKELQIQSFCDLFAGAGNFTLPLLKLGASGVAVENEMHAMAACQASALAQNLEGGTFIRGDAIIESQRLRAKNERFDLVVIDPPRAGAKSATPNLGTLTSTALVYFSCNPASLSRDLRLLLAMGLRLESITAYDMFEHTRHVETCVWLSAKRQAV